MARNLRIISVGKAHDPLLLAKIREYEVRLSPFFRVTWALLSPKTEATRTKSIASESNSIHQTLKDAEYVILLDESGTQLTSEDFSSLIAKATSSYKDISIVIGGAFGVDNSIKERANATVSFGRMVLPHQLIRLVLIEQLYRAAQIQAGSEYHHS